MGVCVKNYGSYRAQKSGHTIFYFFVGSTNPTQTTTHSDHYSVENSLLEMALSLLTYDYTTGGQPTYL